MLFSGRNAKTKTREKSLAQGGDIGEQPQLGVRTPHEASSAADGIS